MPTEVWVAIIGGAALILAGWIKGQVEEHKSRVQLDHIRTGVGAALHQVQNEHGTNLREDVDALTSTVDTLAGTMDRLRADTLHMRYDVRDLHRDVTQIRETDSEAHAEHRSIWQAIKNIGGTGHAR
ncbi:MAG: hypothetical protein ACRDQA_23700 [Nocardioidaceae bacterium]